MENEKMSVVALMVWLCGGSWEPWEVPEWTPESLVRLLLAQHALGEPDTTDNLSRETYVAYKAFKKMSKARRLLAAGKALQQYVDNNPLTEKKVVMK